ncbi:DUF5677 domain-containing protein [Streptomyces canus]|uniref:DUF5677 domain-containing protein n=1 Tax=Streptomyces canus TaxID=58343 RepID=UPI002254C423|nr:DUF5677 domain-containing protein [Streptomyces canus]MCX4861230.1 DUF5677 domain-containing protein [Streptomyces canus]
MAKSRRRKPVKDRKNSGARKSGNPRVPFTRSPEKFLRPSLELLPEVAITAQRAINSANGSDDRLVEFDIHVLNRGANSMKAVRVLLEQGYWEYAVGVVRQLFELLVNMEYLAKQDDREEAVMLFTRFGALQTMRAQHRGMEYSREKGRPIDDQHFAQLEWHLQNDFTDFRANSNSGTDKWVASWYRKTVAHLAEASSDPMRKHHYNILYRVWSEEAHAAPGALIASLFQDENEDDEWLERRTSENEKHCRDAACFAVLFFVNLWLHLPHIEKPVQQIDGWIRTLNSMHEVSGFPTPPVSVVKQHRGGLRKNVTQTLEWAS